MRDITPQKLLSLISHPLEMVRIENHKCGSTRRNQIVFSSVLASVGESDCQAHVTHISNENNYYNYKLKSYAIREWDTLEIAREEIIVEPVTLIVTRALKRCL